MPKHRVRKHRMIAGYLGLWLLAVGGGSVFAWAAIRQAGEQATLLGPVRAAATAPTTPSGAAAPTTAPPPTTPAVPPTVTPTVPPTGAPGSGSGPGGASPAPPSSVPPPVTVDGSQVTRGGTVAMACTGARLVFRSARPQDGWRLAGPSPEDGGLEVKFEHPTAGEVKVRSSCVAGRPVFAVEEETE